MIYEYDKCMWIPGGKIGMAEHIAVHIVNRRLGIVYSYWIRNKRINIYNISYKCY